MKELVSFQVHHVSGGIDGLSVGVAALSGFCEWDYEKTTIYVTAFNGISGMVASGFTSSSGALVGLVFASGFGFLSSHYGYQLGQYMLMQYDQPQGI